MDYAGYYINLDRETGRRVAMEAELAHYGLGQIYSRFPGVKGNAHNLSNPNDLKDSVLGCFTSHYMALKENLGCDRHLHIIEDDVVFAPCSEQAIRWAMDSGKLDHCDILYTDVSIPLRSDSYKMYRSMYTKMVSHDANGNIENVAFDVFGLKDTVYASAASYLVNGKSIAKLCDLYSEEMSRGLQLPFDLFLRQRFKDGLIKVGCLFPFVTSINFDHVLKSSIDENLDIPTALARLIGRHSCFVGCDWAKCEDYLQTFLALPPASDHQAHVLGHLLAFSLTDAYRLF